MNIDVELLLRSVEARDRVVTWLLNRPNVGLDVTDVAVLCDGYDLMGKALAELTGQDITQMSPEQLQANHIKLEGNYEGS